MTREGNPITNEQLEAYLDGQMSPTEWEAFEAKLRDDLDVRSHVQLQSYIDASLRRQFAVPSASEQGTDQILSEPDAHAASPGTTSAKLRFSRRWLRTALLASAAAVAWAIVWWQLPDRTPDAPFFEPRPLAQIYRETVAAGFEPYYECRDDDRFAATFLQRQGLPLRLARLPDGSRMLGLSYSGGVSRNTTAMLCRVDEQPVMVFVDRLQSDQPLAMRNDDPDLRVVRRQYHDLVMYEVTPFETSRILDYLVLAEASSSAR